MIRISIAMTTYNGEKYVEKQLQSLLDQSRPADEVIIRDDASSDRTAEIVSSFIQEHQLSHWSFTVNNHNLGFKRNFFEAIKQTTGDIIFLCDQDDIWNPEKLKKMAEVFSERADIYALNSSFSFVDQDDRSFSVPLKKNFANNNLIRVRRFLKESEIIQIDTMAILNSNISPGCTMAFRKEVRKIYLENSTCELVHDWELNLIAASLNGLFYYHVPLIRYRIHSGNTIGFSEITRKSGSLVTARYQYRLEIAKLICNNVTFFDNYIFLLNQAERLALQEKASFMQKRLDALERKNFFSVLLLNRYWRQYSQTITWKGRLADILCVILPAGKDSSQ